MDPKECLRLADQYISDGRYVDARIQLAEYWRWRARGGFEPFEVAGSLKRGDEFARECRARLESATLPINLTFTCHVDVPFIEITSQVFPSLDAALIWATEQGKRIDETHPNESRSIFCEDTVGNSWSLIEDNSGYVWQQEASIDKMYPIGELPLRVQS